MLLSNGTLTYHQPLRGNKMARKKIHHTRLTSTLSIGRTRSAIYWVKEIDLLLSLTFVDAQASVLLLVVDDVAPSSPSCGGESQKGV